MSFGKGSNIRKFTANKKAFENLVGKAEKAGQQHFSPFLTRFSIRFAKTNSSNIVIKSNLFFPEKFGHRVMSTELFSSIMRDFQYWAVISNLRLGQYQSKQFQKRSIKELGYLHEQ